MTCTCRNKILTMVSTLPSILYPMEYLKIQRNYRNRKENGSNIIVSKLRLKCITWKIRLKYITIDLIKYWQWTPLHLKIQFYVSSIRGLNIYDKA